MGTPQLIALAIDYIERFTAMGSIPSYSTCAAASALGVRSSVLTSPRARACPPAKMSDRLVMPMPGPVLAASSLNHYLLVALVTFFVYLVGSYLTSPVRHYPGPLLASR